MLSSRVGASSNLPDNAIKVEVWTADLEHQGKIYVRLGVLTPATVKLVEKRVPDVYRNLKVARVKHYQEKFKHG